LSVDQIKPYWRNPRINQATIEPLKASIHEFGFNQPLVLDANNVVIVGHARLKAATQLGLKEVPCVVTDMKSAQAKAYRIADNKVGESTKWDMDMLIPELRELDAADMQAYFPDVSLDELLKDTAGNNFTMPTQQQIDQQAAESEGQFQRAFEGANSNLVNVTCPHCGEEFGIGKGSIE